MAKSAISSKTLPTIPLQPTADEQAHAGACQAKATVEEPRTISYPLRTGGSLTSTCPSWCTTDHSDDVARGINPGDLLHQGDAVSLDYGVDGVEQSILQARIAAWPFDADGETTPYVELVPEGRTGVGRICTSPLELAEEIRRVRGHLRALEELADRLAEAQADDHARDHRGDLTPWTSLSHTDLLSMPIAYLLRVFGVTVQESAEIGDKVSVVLGGEPGDMLLLVHPSLAQHVREDETRTALLSWYEARNGGRRD
ncbi:DUF6907 domain-containing protein [Streptomyces sp. NPDC001852]|uniref:DUF6907 domain-containing protein n=1 Tax=Streptomyces sp. NPDC001852 TaxID=3364619 RepID=UPI0036BE07F0